MKDILRILRQATDGNKLFANQKSDKGLVLKYGKYSQDSTIRKQTIPFLKLGKII